MPPFYADCWGQAEAEDELYQQQQRERGHQQRRRMSSRKQPVLVEGPIIVGAGPAGLAAAASLKDKDIPSLIIERADCIASLWKYKTYDRLHLHIPKHFCELPLMPFPEDYPAYPTRQQFIDYLEDYASHFHIRPRFNQSVASAAFDSSLGMWRVRTTPTSSCRPSSQEDDEDEEEEYASKWLIVATGENAETVTPQLPGMDVFRGESLHSSQYRNGAQLRDKKVLVVGCGNSGMEIALDLANHGARPSIAVRSPVHVLPREVLGRSTLQVAMALLRVFPMWVTDYILVLYTWLLMGNTAHYGLCRPSKGPMELKDTAGKTPVLDVGTVAKIRSGHIKVTCAVQSLTRDGVTFADGTCGDFDCIIWATGFRSNVPRWLKDDTVFGADGLPKAAFPHGWKGTRGLYVAGMSKRGLKGTSFEARQIAQEISTSFEKQICVCPVPVYSSRTVYKMSNPSTQGLRTR